MGIGLEKGIQAGLQAEANAFGELAMTPVSAALRGLFFASTALKNESGSTAKAEKIAKVGILGGGLMGEVSLMLRQCVLSYRLESKISIIKE